jgi:hypothetical protein
MAAFTVSRTSGLPRACSYARHLFLRLGLRLFALMIQWDSVIKPALIGPMVMRIRKRLLASGAPLRLRDQILGLADRLPPNVAWKIEPMRIAPKAHFLCSDPSSPSLNFNIHRFLEKSRPDTVAPGRS